MGALGVRSAIRASTTQSLCEHRDSLAAAGWGEPASTRALTHVCPVEVFVERACRCTKKEPDMKFVSTIGSTVTQKVEAEGEDDVATREQLLAPIP